MNTARKHAEFADSFTQYDLEFFAHLRSFVKLLARHGVRAEALSPTGITEYKGLGSGFVNFLIYERGQLIFRRAYLWPAKMSFEIRTAGINE